MFAATQHLGPRSFVITLVALICMTWGSPQARAQGECVPSPAGLLAWWTGDDTTLDAVGGNHGSWVGTPSYTDGMVGRAFVTGSAYVSVPHSETISFPPGAEATFELWANRTGGGLPFHIFGKRIGCGGGIEWNYQLGIDSSVGEVPFNQWVHWAMVFHTAGISIYTNGNVYAEFPGATFGPENTTDLTIGTVWTCAPFVGFIDELAIYDRALSLEEIQAIHAAGSAGKCLPPTVAMTSPRNGEARIDTAVVVSATFTMAMDPTTIDASTFQLLAGNGEPVAGVVAYDPDTLTATLTPAAPLRASSFYYVTITTGVRSMQGESMPRDYLWGFATVGMPATIWWVGGSGDWSNPANWSGDTLPGPEDDVLIDNPSGDWVVTITGGDHVVRSLKSTHELHVGGGSLTVSEIIETTKDLLLAGGTIRGGTIAATNGAKLVVTADSVLDGVVLEADMAIGVGGKVTVTNGLVLNGVVTINGAVGGNNTSAIFFADDDSTLAGTGQIVLVDSGFYEPAQTGLRANRGTLTIGPGITIRGGDGTVGTASLPLVVQGRILADTAGRTIRVTGSSVTNLGTMEAVGGGSLWVNNLVGGAGLVASGSGGLSLVGIWQNTGIISVSGGATLSLSGSWSNGGTISVSNSTVNLGGTFTLEQLGVLERSAATVNLTGTLNNVGTGLVLDSTTGPFRIMDGSRIVGGTVTGAGGVGLVMPNAGFFSGGAWLDGVVLEADMAIGVGGKVTVTNGLVLNGVVTINGAVGGNNTSAIFFADDDSTLAGTGQIVLVDSGFYEPAQTGLRANSGTLTIGPGITIRGGDGTVGTASLPLVVQGRILADTAGRSIRVAGTSVSNLGVLAGHNWGVVVVNHLTNDGTIQASAGGVVDINSPLAIYGQSMLVSQPPGIVRVAEHLHGNVTSPLWFTPEGHTTLDGAGTAGSPQLLEVMSRDMGTNTAGFSQNFVYGTLELAHNTYVRLVDQSDNSPGTNAEALYVNFLIVPAGCTLDLNGFNVYTRAAAAAGNLLNGSFAQVPDSGPITLGTVTPGAIALAGESDEWTCFGRAGEVITVVVDPGSDSVPSPRLEWMEVQVLHSAGGVLASNVNTVGGQALVLPDITLPSDGLCRVQVRAHPSYPSSMGGYAVTVWNTTPDDFTLVLNQQVVGRTETPYSVDRWNFSAVSNTQVRFDLVSVSQPGIEFKLTGPVGWIGSSNLTGSSGFVTLPTSGSYSLTAYGTGGQYGVDYAFKLVETVQTELALGVPFNGQFIGNGQAQLFRIHVPTNNPMQVVLINDGTGNRNELYLSFGEPPTRGTFDYRFGASGSSQQITVPHAYAGTWYVLVYGDTITAPSDFTLEATTAGMFLSSVTPSHHGNSADARLTLTGAGFDPTTLVSLISSNNTIYSNNLIAVDSFTQLTVTIPSNSLPAGRYTIRAWQPDGDTSELPEAFLAEAGGEPKLDLKIVVPAFVTWWGADTLYVEYANTGNVAMASPLLMLQGTKQPYLTLDAARVVPEFWSTAAQSCSTASHSAGDTVQFLASGSTPGLLQPGERVRVPVHYLGMAKPWSYGNMQLSLTWLPADSNHVIRPVTGQPLATPVRIEDYNVDWAALKDGMRPNSIDPGAWDIIWANFTATAGNTWFDYVRLLLQQPTPIRHMQLVDDVMDRLAFAFLKADGLSPVRTLASSVDAAVEAPGLSLVFSRTFPATISGRFRPGPLGRGWSHNWQYSIEVESDCAVVIWGPGGSRRLFKPDSRFMLGGGLVAASGQYFPEPGDQGTLKALGGGVFTLRETSGLLRVFRPDGKLDYMEDLNGNRIACGYSANLLTSLTHSSGQWLQITYSGGYIHSLTDSVGRQTLLSYSGEHLSSAQYSDGRAVGYSYNSSGPGQHGLAQVASSCCTSQFFEYDPHGWLYRIHRGGGAEAVTFGYDGTGRVTATDALGNVSQFHFDQRGLLVRAINPLGHAVQLAFDRDYNLATLTDPAGRSHSYNYDGKGNLVRSIDPLGNTTRLTFSGDFNRLASVTDARNNPTHYGHDNQGNLRSITYADGSVERWAYDTVGNATTWTNRRGNPIAYEYDSAGRLTNKAFADASLMTYAYDARGNLTNAVVFDMNGAVQHFSALAYDHNDRLTNITYPDDKWLAFTYDSAGRRASSLDQTGHLLTYHYDSVGRLASMTNEISVAIVRYDYDLAGRLNLKTLGNGVFTTYAYDAAGQLLQMTNFLSDSTVLSFFNYTYDSRGRRTSMDCHYGLWTYDYDDLGQLTRAVLDSIAPDIPDQDLTYVYDALGNRIRTIENGIPTEYTANNLNQYIRVGSTNYVFDADGNLVQEITAQGTHTFAYNDENRMVGVTRGADSRGYVYGALGDRVMATGAAATTRYVLDPIGLGNVVAEYNGAMNQHSHFDHGLGLLRRKDSASGQAYYVCDPIGNVVGSVDAVGGAGTMYSFLPFGGRHGVGGNFGRHSFGGEYGWSGSFGLLYARARYYSAELGRFVSSDPLRSPTQHMYNFAWANPISFIDPMGLLSIEVGQSGQGGAGVGGTAGWRIVWIPGTVPHLFFEGGMGSYIGVGASYTGNFGLTSASSYNTREQGVTLQSGGSLSALGGGLGLDHVFGENYWGGQFSFGVQTGPLPGAPSGEWHEFASWSYDAGSLFQLFDIGYALQFYLGRSLLSLPGPTTSSTNVWAGDPNQMTGPAGFGPAGYVPADMLLSYRIDFENEPEATAPAQQVVISNPLNANLNYGTFELTDLGWGDRLILIPPNSQHFQTNVPVSVDGMEFVVEIQAGINVALGKAYAVFRSMNPATGLPPRPGIGFLPPEDGTGRGQGHVSYVIRPKPKLPTGTEIRNVALISFDNQAWIATDQVDPHDASKGIDPNKQALVTIDADPPSSLVAPLPVEVAAPFRVRWSGDDGVGSGVVAYDIQVAEIAGGVPGPWTDWQIGTPLTEASFEGALNRTYAFRSRARDGVGHLEEWRTVADASTTVTSVVNRPPIVESIADQFVWVGDTLKVDVRATDPDVGQTLSYALINGPMGMVLADTNLLVWSPGADQAGDWPVTIEVTDSGSPPLSARATFVVRAGLFEVGWSVSGGNLTLSVPTMAGRAYRIETCADLGTKEWLPVPGYEVIQGTGVPVVVQLAIGSEDQRFYRVAGTLAAP